MVAAELELELAAAVVMVVALGDDQGDSKGDGSPSYERAPW